MKRSSIHRLANLAVWSTLLLMVFGAYARSSGSEFGLTGRLIAAFVGFLAIVITFVAWRSDLDRRWVLLPSASALVMIGLEALLGLLADSGDGAGDPVPVYIFVSLMIVALFVIVAVSTRRAPDGPNLLERDWSRQLGVGAGAVLIVLMIGSLVHDTYVPGLFLVNGEWVPELGGFDTVTVHWAHRMASAAALVYLLFLVWRGANVDRPHNEGYLVIGATSLYILNLGLGLLNVWTEVDSSWVVALHLGFGAAVWTALLAATFLSFHDPR